MTKTAISFKVPPRLWKSFKEQTDSLFISRAPFLSYMVKGELRHLTEELAGLRLSTAAKRYISGELKRQEPVSVNIEVEPETADALRAATKAHNLVRDAFMCRLIIFLRSNDAFLDWLELPRLAANIRGGGSLQDMPASPLRAMEAVRDDPLYYVRNRVEDIHGCGIYRVPLMLGVDWAACYLEDDVVPKTRAFKRRKKELDEALGFLVETSTPGKAASASKKGVAP